MKMKRNVDALLDQKSAPAEFRKAIVMQLPVALINDLKQRVLDLSVSSGKRITQQQLLEEALRNYLYK